MTVHLGTNISDVPTSVKGYMSKTLRHDYRREAQEIIKNLGMTDHQIALQLQVSEFSIRRWRKGLNSPQPFQFERLRKLVPGSPQLEKPPDKPPGELPSRQWLEGKFDQLTNQIALLQGQVHHLNVRVTVLEEAVSPAEKKPGHRKLSFLSKRSIRNNPVPELPGAPRTVKG